MSIAIGAASTSGQLTATGPQRQELPTVFKKIGQTEQDDQQRMQLAQDTGKGQNIDIRV